MATHANRVQMTVSGTPGTGTITLGSASSGYRTFASAYGGNATVDVLITDGTAWEVARGCTYTNSGTTLSRGTLESSSTGSAINLTSAAIVSVIATAEFGNKLEMQLDRALTIVRNNGSTTQSLTGSAYTKISGAFTTVDANPYTWWDTTNKKFTPTRAGNYLVVACIQGSTVSANLVQGLYKNGTIDSSGPGGPASDYNVCGGTFIANMNGSTDYIELYVYNGGSTQNTYGSAGNNYIKFLYLGP